MKYNRAINRTNDNITRSERFACWVDKARYTNSGFVNSFALYIHNMVSLNKIYKIFSQDSEEHFVEYKWYDTESAQYLAYIRYV